MTTSLYEQDILLWVEDTVNKLKNRDFKNLDIDNLIEEVESLGISQKKELISRLMVLLEHLLKRLYVDLPYDYNGWERTIRNQRNALELLLRDAPSLKIRWDDSFIVGWEIALKTVRKEHLQVAFPDRWAYAQTIESILNEDFWEEN
jgi:hypothetical protein